MNAAAKGVMAELPDIVIGYGISDEYRSGLQSSPCKEESSTTNFANSFVFHKSCSLFERRARYACLLHYLLLRFWGGNH